MTGLYLAHYRIDAELGRGGMGVVYRATDTMLDRTVALKVLPPHALASADDRARFYREAKAAAQLHHPHIATVFQIDEAALLAEGAAPAPDAEKRLFIAMEYIEGETVEARIRKGPLKLTEAVSIAVQVAEALKAAHAKQIVHRDIKSANVMLASDGVAKVLDFGLAKTQASTMLTRQGSTLGTVAYMSPEQARAQEVDGRSDLYSLGTVLYEMVAGRLPFAGDYEQAILYGILNEPPEPLTSLRTGVPMELERITNKLLAKEQDFRYQTAADLIADLKSLDLSGSGASRRSVVSVGALAGAARPAAAAAGRRWFVAGAAGVLGLLLGVALMGWVRPEPPRQRRAFDRPMPGLSAAAMSPVGDSYAYVERDTLYVRDLANLSPRSVVPTRSRILAWSPDGTYIAYAEDSELWRINVTAGAPEQIASVRSGAIHGVVWKPSGTVVMSVRSGSGVGVLMSVPATGGEPEVIRRSNRAEGVASFAALTLGTDGETIIASVVTEEQQASVRALSAGENYPLVSLREGRAASGYDIAVTRSGDLLVSRDNGIWRYALAADSRATVGDPERIAPEGAILPSAGGNGTYLYIQTDPEEYRAFWREANGAVAGSFGRNVRTARLAIVHPDERRLVVHDEAGGLWIADDRGTATPLDTRYDRVDIPFDWFPDGRRLVFGSWRSGSAEVYVVDIGSIGAPQPLTVGEVAWGPTVSPAGLLVYYRITEETGRDLYARPLDIRPDTVIVGELQLYLMTPANEAMPSVHPSGDYLAYQSDASGRWEVHVRSLPDPNVSFQPVTVDGGLQPLWDPTGRWLYFIGLDGVLYRAPFDASRSNPVGSIERLFNLERDAAANPYDRYYDVSPTSGRVVSYVRTRAPRPPRLTIVQNP